jgi:hypothetical protein
MTIPSRAFHPSRRLGIERAETAGIFASNAAIHQSFTKIRGSNQSLPLAYYGQFPDNKSAIGL